MKRIIAPIEILLLTLFHFYKQQEGTIPNPEYDPPEDLN
jgi:hypothetical protein